jgi:glycosyltransferase involved in cell wall biosynthesis
MLKLAQSPDLRRKMGRAGQERVRKYFDWERKVDRIVEIYHQTKANTTIKPIVDTPLIAR